MQESVTIVDIVRQFNRFYTKQIGVLQESLLKSDYSLTEVRVLYEIAHHENPTATTIAEELALDEGYLSRIISSFKKKGLIAATPSKTDARQNVLSLTEHGEKLINDLNSKSHNEVAAMLESLSERNRERLVRSMKTIEDILSQKSEESYILREHCAGDMGWVIHRHGLLYHQEFGWNEEFEALVAEVAARFLREYNPARERCWIAEKDGEIIGSIFLVSHSKTVAKIRLLLVEPTARGLGLGTELVNECIEFARSVGYKKITLWTNSVLQAARHIYESAGFTLVEEETHMLFGQNLVSQTWELKL